jgi:hypothetical protein
MAASFVSIYDSGEELSIPLSPYTSRLRLKPKSETITIDVSTLFDKTAKLHQLPVMIKKVKELAGEGNNIILTGPGPVWLYLKLSHSLHGKVRTLTYTSPATGIVIIMDHNSY